MSSANLALFSRLRELGLQKVIEGGPKYLGECNECQAQWIKAELQTKDDRETRIITISTTITGSHFLSSTCLINPKTRAPIWFEENIMPPGEIDEDGIVVPVNEIIANHLRDILLLIKDDDFSTHSLSSITEAHGKNVAAYYEDLSEADTCWILRDYNFHLRFSCADIILGVTGHLGSPEKVYLRELRWGATDFAECSYFEEICSDLEMDPELID